MLRDKEDFPDDYIVQSWDEINEDKVLIAQYSKGNVVMMSKKLYAELLAGAGITTKVGG